MHTITMRHKKKCRPVTIISISKTTSNNTLFIEWSNPYNMTGAVTLQVSLNNGVTFINVQQLDVTSNSETVYSNVLGTIPNGQTVIFRLIITTEACGDIPSNTITVVYIREPIIILDVTGSSYIDYIQNTYKNWRINMPSTFTDLITETGTYKFDFEISKNQNMLNALTTIFRLGTTTSNFISLPTLNDPPIGMSVTNIVDIPQQVGTANASITINLNAGVRLYMLYYQYNGGYMRLGTNVKVKVTRL